MKAICVLFSILLFLAAVNSIASDLEKNSFLTVSADKQQYTLFDTLFIEIKLNVTRSAIFCNYLVVDDSYDAGIIAKGSRGSNIILNLWNKDGGILSRRRTAGPIPCSELENYSMKQEGDIISIKLNLTKMFNLGTPGVYIVRVSYIVDEEELDALINESKMEEKKNSPIERANFWHGEIQSNPIAIEIIDSRWRKGK